ncbi:rhomboid family intramembrane serine protease [Sphingorhabdus soli]|uniref:Rhomboid family intramembrane serine protease n=1 Tax=Flavisphingopyxis soli TaxID=2601267 RepID=A0A5C6U7U5_9SPHN|nr:rhomboid family intramembrane serine protease [Sphingorhabdus soli]TXC69077.1 rhomboid family intramembrane serine protease [Sphingorhabdus soli]
MRMPPGLFTNIILAVTVIAWAALALSGWQDYGFIAGGFIPARVAGLIDLPGAVPVWLTPLSSTLLHSGAMHIAFNGLMLLFCGRFVELALGRWLMLALYLVGAYAAAAAQYLADPASIVPVVGASGAISALVGAYALLFSKRRVAGRFGIPPVVLHVAWLAVAWIGLQVMVGYAFGGSGMAIAIWAHVGGFLAGLALAVPMLRLHERQVIARGDDTRH